MMSREVITRSDFSSNPDFYYRLVSPIRLLPNTPSTAAVLDSTGISPPLIDYPQ